MVETTEGNGAEPRRPKKVQRKGPAKTGKAAALAQLVERPELVSNVSAAARMWGVSRSTAREWMRAAAMVVPPEPPPVPPSPVAAAMVNPSHDEPFQAEPPLRDEQPRQEAPVAATMGDERPAGEGALGAMAVPVATPSPVMAATMAEPAPLMEKSAGVLAPLEPPQWRTVERPVWHLTVPVLCPWIFGGMSVAPLPVDPMQRW